MKRRSLNFATWFLTTAVALRNSELQFSSLPALTVTKVPSSTPPRQTTRKAVGSVLLERQWVGKAVQITQGEPVRTSSPPKRADGAEGSPIISVRARSAQRRSVLVGALAFPSLLLPCGGDDDDDSVGDANSLLTAWWCVTTPEIGDTCISFARSMMLVCVSSKSTTFNLAIAWIPNLQFRKRERNKKRENIEYKCQIVRLLQKFCTRNWGLKNWNTHFGYQTI